MRKTPPANRFYEHHRAQCAECQEVDNCEGAHAQRCALGKKLVRAAAHELKIVRSA